MICGYDIRKHLGVTSMSSKGAVGIGVHHPVNLPASVGGLGGRQRLLPGLRCRYLNTCQRSYVLILTV